MLIFTFNNLESYFTALILTKRIDYITHVDVCLVYVCLVILLVFDYTLYLLLFLNQNLSKKIYTYCSDDQICILYNVSYILVPNLIVILVDTEIV